jgi:hypothetical protein
VKRGDLSERFPQAALRQRREIDEDGAHLERDAPGLQLRQPMGRERVRFRPPVRTECDLEEEVVVSVDDERASLTRNHGAVQNIRLGNHAQTVRPIDEQSRPRTEVSRATSYEPLGAIATTRGGF